jgi:hypothetical protein
LLQGKPREPAFATVRRHSLSDVAIECRRMEIACIEVTTLSSIAAFTELAVTMELA